MTQYGFYFDQSRCVGCQCCAISCKSWNVLPPGPVKWARVFQWEKGSFPSVRMHTLFAPCYHCGNPVCVDAANGAMYKEDKYGAVLIDPAKATSASLKAAWDACPYGAIVFDSDSPTSTASKCTMCVDRLEQGNLPVCVMACPMRALDFGPLADLKTKYGTLSDLEDVPSGKTVNPSVVFKAHDAKKQLVPYDSQQALTVLAGRPSGLPKVYSQPTDVTDVPSGLIMKNKLVMKPTTIQEFIVRTRDNNS